MIAMGYIDDFVLYKVEVTTIKSVTKIQSHTIFGRMVQKKNNIRDINQE